MMLLKLIDKKGITEAQCYHRANVSKQTFWKIMNNDNYRPSKPTVISFAVAPELTWEETESLLRTVGFSMSHSNKFDLIIEFYIRSGCYDLFEIDAALLLELDKQTLQEKCRQYDISPQRNEVGDWGLSRYDLRKLHNTLYYEDKKNVGGRRGDDPWA